MKLKNIIITLLVLVAAYAAFWAYKQMNLLKNTSIKMLNYSFAGLFTKNAIFNATVRVTNNSDIDLQAHKGSFKIYINNQYVAQSNITITQLLKAKSSIDLPLSINFNPATVVKQGVQALLANPNDVTIGIKGGVSVISNYISLNNIKIDEKFLLSQLINK